MADTDFVTEAQINALITNIAASHTAYVFHGSNASTARPANVAVAIWVGDVEPINAIASTDFWNDTGGSPLFTAETIIDGGAAATF